MSKPYLSIIIPAYNEAERIPETLRDIHRKLAKAPYAYEIIVVNDGSKDKTADVVRRMAEEVQHLRLIDNKENKGKGGVVRQGMLAAEGEIRLFMDADNSTSVDQVEKMLPEFAKGYGVVIGSRGVLGAKLTPPQPFYKHLLGRMSNLVIQAVNLPGVWDSQCGFKAFTAEAAENIFSRSRIVGWGFDIETLALARALGYKIKEVPIVWVNNPFSHVKLSAYLKTFVENLTIRWWLIIGSYNLKVEKSNCKMTD